MTNHPTDWMACLSRLDDGGLLRQLRQHVERERERTVAVVVHLAEVEARKLYLAEGHGSVYDYVTAGLGYAEGAGYKRMQAASAVRRFPEALSFFCEGRIHLSNLCVLAPHLTSENVVRLLEAAAKRPKRYVEAMVKALKAEAAAKAAAARAAAAPPAAAAARVSPPSTRTLSFDFAAPGRPDEPPAPAPAPLAPARRTLTVRASNAFMMKLSKAKALLAHAVPGGDTEALLERALDLLIEKEEARRFGAKKPRNTRAAASKAPTAPAEEPVAPNAPPDHRPALPVEVRREVYARDEGCCTFTAESGQVCRSRHAIQFHHILAYAYGGLDTVDNITLHCALHNRYVAEREGLARPETRARPKGRHPGAAKRRLPARRPSADPGAKADAPRSVAA